MYIYIYTLSQKKRYPYNNVNNLRTEAPIHSPFRATLGLPIWHIPTNFGQYILKNEDSGEFSARKGCATQWPSWEISICSMRDNALMAVKISLLYFYSLCWLWKEPFDDDYFSYHLLFRRIFFQENISFWDRILDLKKKILVDDKIINHHQGLYSEPTQQIKIK
jgi:hypothetical protein